MKIRNKTGFPFAPLLGRVNFPSYSVTPTVRATFKLTPGETVTPIEEQPQFEGDVKGENEVLYPADLVPFKPKADLLLRATCHTPGGRPMTACTVKFALDDWSKELAVIGNRTWDKGIVFNKMGEPEEFNTVELTWANAFGGENYRLNPAGKGRKDGRLPNVEFPDELVKSPGNQPTPAGFGPIAATWKQRSSKLGTYDKKWLKERWPALPRDFDWTYFNAAPDDQQVDFPRGDETLKLVNMHPDHAELAAMLPGLRMRCLVRRREGAELAEHDVPMNLDTVYVNAQEETVTLVWRGVSNIREEEGEDIEDFLVWSENLADAPLSIDEVRPWLEEEPEPVEPYPGEAIDVDTPVMEGEALGEALQAAAAAQARSMMLAVPAAAGLLHTNAEMFQGLGQARTAIAGLIAKFKGAGQAVPPELTTLAHDLDNNPDILEAESDALISEALSMLPVAAALTGPALALALKKGEAGGKDFAGAELAGEDLSGADLENANFTGANLAGANLDGAKLSGAQFVEANLGDAKLTNVQSEGVTFSHANLERADFTGASLTDSLFDNVKGRELVLTGAQFPGAMFADADLTGADATEGKFENADFSRANLTDVKFEKSELPGAIIISAKCTGATFKEASAPGLRASEANLAGVNLEEAVLEGGIFDNANCEGANFRYAALKGAMFSNANLAGAVLFGAVLRQGSLRKANLSGAQADNADFFEADLEKSNLSGASLVASNCYGAAFRDANTDGAKLNETNLKQTLLA
jgi:uncharacterized protein YjbI with pentapeptide repeats